ncbi:MAG: hypothetical protein IPJ65_36160 [Archangiaceae bacterium]|nr:hypothetical protein [Archangiaceae bacterium]
MRSEAVATFAVLLAACGTGAPAPDYDPPLLTLRGVLTQSGSVNASDARVALVWRRPASSLMLLYGGTAQQVSIRPEFPLRFELELHRLPPREAMAEVFEGVRAAVGTVLVYADDNSNGALDLLDPGAKTSDAIDHVLGTPADTTLLYVESDSDPTSSSGFHLLRRPTQVPPYDPGSFDELRLQAPQLLPTDTVFDVPLTADPQLATEMCVGLGEPDPNGVVCAGACPTFSLPDDAVVHCSADRRSFTADACPPPGTLCARNGCMHTLGEWPEGEPRPGGWPCD